jgi:hypothetical protein
VGLESCQAWNARLAKEVGGQTPLVSVVEILSSRGQGGVKLTLTAP